MDQPAEYSELLRAIREAAKESPKGYLTYASFHEVTGISKRRILKHFDSWSDACKAAGVQPGEASPNNIVPRESKGKAHALAEVRRVANELGVDELSTRDFDAERPAVKAKTVSRLWGGWTKALEAAGLRRHSMHFTEAGIAELAVEFLCVLREIGSLPTAQQLARRSVHGEYCFSRKFGGYATFKAKAIEHLLANENLSNDERKILGDQLEMLASKEGKETDTVRPHLKGRTLNFRAFAYAPTYENEVVALFGSVASELGFEIVAQRPAFPDCEARRLVDKKRKRYQKCMIEFELRSSDYKKHGHPQKGCDLIVCWEHDWTGAPIEVLELESAINRLDGWK